jgi:Family of unknown function (DUF6516)
MRARLLVHRRDRWRPGTFTEIVVWAVPRQVPGSTHRYKYRLALIDDGDCVLRYDNETGKGDHRHIGSQEEPYRFTSIERLLDDFETATRAWLDEHPHHR